MQGAVAADRRGQAGALKQVCRLTGWGGSDSGGPADPRATRELLYWVAGSWPAGDWGLLRDNAQLIGPKSRRHVSCAPVQPKNVKGHLT